MRKLTEQHTAVVRHRIALSEAHRIPEWLQQTLHAVERRGQPAGMLFVRFFAMDPASMDIEIGWPVTAPFAGDGEVTASTLPDGPAAVATYHGPYIVRSGPLASGSERAT